MIRNTNDFPKRIETHYSPILKYHTTSSGDLQMEISPNLVGIKGDIWVIMTAI